MPDLKILGLTATAADPVEKDILKQLFSPTVKFLQTYLFKLGLLDGLAGWRIARYSAHGVKLKYAKLAALRAQRAQA